MCEAEQNLARVGLHHFTRHLGLGRPRAHADAVAGSPRSRVEGDDLAFDEEGVAAARALLDGSLREAGNAFLQAGQEGLVDGGDGLLHVLLLVVRARRHLLGVERFHGDTGVVRELEGLDDLELVEILLAPRRVLAGSGARLAGRAGGDGKPGHQQPGEALGHAHVSSS